MKPSALSDIPAYDGQGETLYQNAAGFQTLEGDSEPLNTDIVFFLASAGKFITHIAALQLVDRGKLILDAPIETIVPELGELPVIEPCADENGPGFTLRTPKRSITLRHMMLHSSGIAGDDTPLLKKWRAVTEQKFPEDAHPIIKMFSTPLLFDPGEGWHYGHSIHWLQLVIANASDMRYMEYVQKNIFDVLGMKSSSYTPHLRDDISSRLLQAVRRGGNGKLSPLPEEEGLAGLACSVSDIKAILSDLVSPTSKILKPESVDLFFTPAFEPGSQSHVALRADTENYAAPIGLTKELVTPPVNYSCGGLVLESVLSRLGLPAGTVTWNGMPNVAWAVSREKGLGVFFGTQLVPVDDEKAVDLMLEFFRGVSQAFCI